MFSNSSNVRDFDLALRQNRLTHLYDDRWVYTGYLLDLKTSIILVGHTDDGISSHNICPIMIASRMTDAELNSTISWRTLRPGQQLVIDDRWTMFGLRYRHNHQLKVASTMCDKYLRTDIEYVIPEYLALDLVLKAQAVQQHTNVEPDQRSGWITKSRSNSRASLVAVANPPSRYLLVSKSEPRAQNQDPWWLNLSTLLFYHSDHRKREFGGEIESKHRILWHNFFTRSPLCV